ncbi:MAG: hypothetical protein SPF41_02200 [Candidatus Merdousia sp.]|nr:hypothetical protein [Candidatus Merdousia sp.]
MAQKCPQDNNILQAQGNKDASKGVAKQKFQISGARTHFSERAKTPTTRATIVYKN